MTTSHITAGERDLRSLRTLYRALGDETRLRMIGLMAELGPVPVKTLSARVGPVAAPHQLAPAHPAAGRPDRHQAPGREVICRLRLAAFEELHEAEARLVAGTAGIDLAPSAATPRRAMSVSHPQAHDPSRGDSILSTRTKQAGRALLAPIVRLALALHITANMVTVIGLLIVIVATILVGTGNLLIGALVLGFGSALDAVDGSLARASGAPPRSARSSTRPWTALPRRSCTAAWPSTSCSRATTPRSRCCSPWWP